MSCVTLLYYLSRVAGAQLDEAVKLLERMLIIIQ